MLSSSTASSQFGTYTVQVNLHTIAHVPKEVAALTTPGLKFRVAVNAVGGDGVVTMQLSKTCPEVSSTFEPRDIQPEHFEVKLDATSGSGRASLEWTSSTPTIDLLVAVKEEMGSDGAKTLSVANPVTVDLHDIIERRKLRTMIIGCSMGQVGISISVAPSDTAGYRRRLEAFLTKYNPEGLSAVAKVLSTVSEVDAFTTVHKKYGIVNYSQRVRKFFATYGPDFMGQCDEMLQQWAKREEELMRNLILDNGPELCDVDLKLRLTAFGKRYKLSPPQYDVTQLMRTPAADVEALFDSLVEKHGAEPDPRPYLFGVTYYGEKPPESPRRRGSRRGTVTSKAGDDFGNSSQQMSSSFGPVVDEVDVKSQRNGGGGRTESIASATPSQYQQPQQQQQSYESSANLRAAASSTYTQSSNPQNAFHEPSAPTGPVHNTLPSSHAIFQHRDAAAENYGGNQAAARSSSSSHRVASNSFAGGQQQQQQQQYAATTNPIELWSAFIDDLRSASVPAAELHYLNEASFLTLVGELGYQGNTRQLLASEWRRRVEQALRAEPLMQGDSLFEAAKRDVITISGLHPLNVTVVGVTLLKNTEHESSFSLRLGEAKLRTTERLMLVGEHHKLLGYASYGVSQQPQLQDATKAAVVFQRRPFAQLLRPTSVAVLVCDVVIGKPYIGTSGADGAGAAPPQQLTAPKEAAPSFLREYDSCVFLDPLAGQSVAVYHPTQVLPKYLVQCNVDTTVSPCPAHPSKPVEYFVVDSNVFACSQCVVMGQHRGKEVLTVEDATLQARSQLQDIQRDVLHVVSEMAAAEADCDRQLQSLPHSELRMSASRQIEQIKREAEQRIAAIHQEVESSERARKDSIQDAKVQAKRVMDDAQNVAVQLDEGLRFRGPNDVISLLMNTKHSGVMESIKDRASSVRHAHHEGHHQPSSVVGVVRPVDGGGGALRSSSILGGGSILPTRGQPSGVQASFASAAVDESFSGLNRTPRTAGGPSVVPPLTAVSANRTGPPNDPSALYSKFLSLKQQQQPTSSSHLATSATPNTSGAAATYARPSDFSSATRSAVKVTADLEAKRMKDLITSGWAEFRKGDKHAAHRIWQDVYERNPHNATGARAKAYIAEAVEKNYQSASQWYEKALSYDPQDCLTLYNYGVLLESVLERKRDALGLFETAHRLGDQTAGKRAAQLRQTLPAA